MKAFWIEFLGYNGYRRKMISCVLFLAAGKHLRGCCLYGAVGGSRERDMPCSVAGRHGDWLRREDEVMEINRLVVHDDGQQWEFGAIGW